MFPINAVDMVLGDTDLCPYDMGTFGSLTTRMFGPALRAAAAEARAVLLELGGRKAQGPGGAACRQGRRRFRNGNARKQSDLRASSPPGKKSSGTSSPSPRSSPSRNGRSWAVRSSTRTPSTKPRAKPSSPATSACPGCSTPNPPPARSWGPRSSSLDIAAAEKVPGVAIIRDGDLVAALHELPDVAALGPRPVKAEFDIPASPLDDENIFDHLLSVAPEARSRRRRAATSSRANRWPRTSSTRPT